MKTSKKQISLFTEDKSTYLQEDFLVNPTPQQENEKGRMMKDIYGQRCLDAFQKCNHVGLWAKTFSDLLIGQGDWYSRRCNLIWRLKGTKYNRIYFQLQPKTLRPEEIESGLLLTPTVTDIGYRSEEAKQKRKEYRESIGRKTVPPGNLSEQVMNLLPTPMAQSRETDLEKTLDRKEKYGGKKRAMYLENYAAMSMLPTPLSSDYKGDRTLKDGKNITKNNQELVLGLEKSARILANKPNETHKNAKLNPQFVAEMMGFPNKWTEKPFKEDAENSFDAVDFNDFPTSYPIVKEEFQPNTISHSRWRKESIKGYGNAVVPQVVLEIFKAIEKYDKFTKS